MLNNISIYLFSYYIIIILQQCYKKNLQTHLHLHNHSIYILLLEDIIYSESYVNAVTISEREGEDSPISFNKYKKLSPN